MKRTCILIFAAAVFGQGVFGAETEAEQLCYNVTKWLTRNRPARLQKYLDENPGAIKKINEAKLYGFGSFFNDKYYDSLALLCRLGLNPNVPNPRFGSYPLHRAVEQKTDQTVSLFLKHGAEVDVRDKNGKTPLLRAAYYGNLPGTKNLLKHKADVKALDKKGWNALQHAMYQRHPEIALLLVEAGSQLEHGQDSNGEWPLHLAIRRGYPEVVRAMLKRGVDIRRLDRQKRTALFHAVRNCEAEIVQMLLDKGAVLTDDLMEMAEKSDNNKVIDVLDKYREAKKKEGEKGEGEEQ